MKVGELADELISKLWPDDLQPFIGLNKQFNAIRLEACRSESSMDFVMLPDLDN